MREKDSLCYLLTIGSPIAHMVLGTHNSGFSLFICELSWSLKFICDPKISFHGTFMVNHRHAQRDKKIEEEIKKGRKNRSLLAARTKALCKQRRLKVSVAS